MKNTIYCVGSLLICSALSSCGGASDVGSPTRPSSVPVSFTIAVPRLASQSHVKQPRYISPSTQSASFAVNGATPIVVNCTATCSGTVNAPVGSDTFAVQLFALQNATGNVLSSGTTTQTILAGSANAVNLTFNPIVASLAISVGPGGPPRGVAGTFPIVVTAYDADNNTILGPGTFINSAGTPTPIALSNSDTSGATALSATSLSAPGTTISLTYTGAEACPTITASTPGVPSASVLLTLNGFGC